MERIIPIVVGLIMGLLGLFMSVCGGGFLVSMGFDALRNVFGAQRASNVVGEFIFMLVPAGSVALGIVVCRSAYQILRQLFKNK